MHTQVKAGQQYRGRYLSALQLTSTCTVFCLVLLDTWELLSELLWTKGKKTPFLVQTQFGVPNKKRTYGDGGNHRCSLKIFYNPAWDFCPKHTIKLDKHRSTQLNLCSPHATFPYLKKGIMRQQIVVGYMIWCCISCQPVTYLALTCKKHFHWGLNVNSVKWSERKRMKQFATWIY